MRKLVVGVVVIAIIAGVVVALIVSGGKDNSKPAANTQNSGGDHTQMNMDNSNNNTSSTPASADKVSISDFSFSPVAITVKKGTTVTWTNNDSISHTVTSDTEHGPNSSTVSSGQTYSFTFNDEGTFNYHCSIHPQMQGTVTVTE